jgi:hypothetical protein
MFKSQSGLCGICSNPLNSISESHVDHDHSTGSVRGLLCRECNTGLGKFKDDTSLLFKAIAYLNNSKTELADVSNVVAISTKKVG